MATAHGGLSGPAVARQDFYRLDWRVDWRRIPSVSWRELPDVIAWRPELLRGRLLLVGGGPDGGGDDLHRAPGGIAGSRSVSGVVLQAVAAHTLLAGRPLRDAPAAAWVAGLWPLAAAAAAAALCLPRWRTSIALLAAAAAAHLLAAWLLFRAAGLLLPVAAPLVVVALAALAASALRVRLPSFPPAEPA